MHRTLLLGTALLLTVLAACRGGSEPAPGSAATPPRAPQLATDATGEPVGLEHFKKWSDELAQGGEPVGERALENLAALGFKTVISVDGAAPPVELAAKWGLRYVHVPIGYDGIEPRAALEIVKAVEVSDGPVYVHCHHGLHRGPAAAAIARIGVEGVDSATAVAGLEASGCKYEGLFRDVGAFAKPSAAELAAIPADLPSVRVPKGLVQSMSYIDRRWDFVNMGSKAKWGALAEHPDIDVAHEVGMIENSFRTLIGEEPKKAQPDARFLGYLREAQSAASELEAAIRASAAEQADRSFARLKKSCEACHADYRNG